ncbi:MULTISPECIES: NCS2 family permease [Spiribacter]|jgi:AGZA family xanthine/uracil permease-like MFS transporter|uniref:NCS2 family permease n=2 Tax=Spiribacter TaxID=1335745 RepID=A0A557RDU8_9GAMM|nr:MULTISPECIES: NCS2 family permease [Spiribacter]AUB78571.1 guanine permease [Spiribacter roseus]KAF0280518.1 guanine permease [Spiribacter roseus]KAF0282145.1 guanine permease [Spiribacter roseus]KAF0284129.1 guanine permease [Spiribacter roseus]KAF0285477.1 guanine permease [Spiribacter sp. SSL99]
MLDRYFELAESGTTIRRELLAGLTTFLTMAYIVVVNPSILSETGMNWGAVFVATCLAAALGSLIMGLYANYPFGLAPGMGLNAYFTYGVVLGMGIAWQTALGAVFLSGILFLIISVLPIREWLINAIPLSLKMAISAGIGFFLAIIALQNAGVVVNSDATLVTLGDLTAVPTLLAMLGFAIMVALSYREVPGAVLIGILAVSLIGVPFGVAEFDGVVSMPPDPSPTFLQMDVAGALELGLVSVVLVFLFVDLFDSTGTLVGLSHRAGFLDRDGRLGRLRSALVADSGASIGGALFGTSTTTTYIESASGINAGGRTGLTAVVIAVLFLLSLFFLPVVSAIPGYATAPALLFVACMMVRGLAELDWDDITDTGPAVVTAIAMPLTYSIADGMGLGFITYVLGKTLAGKPTAVHPAVWLIAALFALRFAFI